MKRFAWVLLVASWSPLLLAQGIAPASSPIQGGAGLRHPKPAVRPPDSELPKAKARVSTAERMAAINNNPPASQLPSFTATDRDGKSFTAASLAKSHHWLLIYRKQSCLPCDRLMTALNASESPSLKGGQPYVIVVASHTSDGLERVRATYQNLSEANWLADKDGQAYSALKPKGTPMIYALDGSRIAWSIPGTLGSPAKIEKMAGDWIAGESTSTTTSDPPAK